MADLKISQLTAKATPVVGDTSIIVDSVGGANKKITLGALPISTATQTALDAKVGGTGTSGHVSYWSGTSSQAGSANFFWDNSNNRLGIGTNSPSQALEIRSATDSGATTGDLIVNTESAAPKVTIGRQTTTVGANGCFEVIDRNGAVVFSVNRSNQVATASLNYFNAGALFGFGTSSPTHAITFANTATGSAFYGTSDQVTNFERMRHAWDGTRYLIGVENGGTGVIRTLRVATRNQAIYIDLNNSPSSAPALMDFNTSATAWSPIAGTSIYRFFTAITGTSLVEPCLTVTPTITQSNTAGYTGVMVSVLETSVGTGSRLLLSLGTNSAAGGAVATHTSRFTVESNGRTLSTTASQSMTYNSAGMVLGLTPGTITDTSSTGTVATFSALGVLTPTVVASSATTYTNASTVFIAGAPTASTNATFSNTSALYVQAGMSLFAGGMSTSGPSTVTTTNFSAVGLAGVSTTSGALAQFGGSASINYRIISAPATTAALGANTSYATQILGSSPVTTAASGTHNILANLVVNGLGTVTSGGAAVTNTAAVYVNGAATGGTNNYAVMVGAGNSYHDGKISYGATNTAAGTTGAQTINKASGTVNFAAAATSLVVTNNLVTTSSIVYAVVRTNDSTAVIKNVVPASGSFTITLNATATAETSVGFFVIN